MIHQPLGFGGGGGGVVNAYTCFHHLPAGLLICPSPCQHLWPSRLLLVSLVKRERSDGPKLIAWIPIPMLLQFLQKWFLRENQQLFLTLLLFPYAPNTLLFFLPLKQENLVPITNLLQLQFSMSGMFFPQVFNARLLLINAISPQMLPLQKDLSWHYI